MIGGKCAVAGARGLAAAPAPPRRGLSASLCWRRQPVSGEIDTGSQASPSGTAEYLGIGGVGLRQGGFHPTQASSGGKSEE